MKDLFVIVRTGVYDQGVVGVSTDLQEAKRIAEKYAAEERDTYHDFEIRRSTGGEFDVEVGKLSSETRWTFSDLPRKWTWAEEAP